MLLFPNLVLLQYLVLTFFLNHLNLVLNPRTEPCTAATVPTMMCHPPIRPAATCTVPRIQLLAARRRHVAASYCTAASDVAPTSAPVNAVCQRRSTPSAAGQRRWITMVIGGQRWRSTTVAGGGPPLTVAGPQLTTTRPPVNGGLHVNVTALGVATAVWMYEVLTKLNPVILNFMASVKRERGSRLKTAVIDWREFMTLSLEIDSDREDEEMQSNDGTDVHRLVVYLSMLMGEVQINTDDIHDQDINREVQINADDIHDQAEEANVPGSEHKPQQHDLDSDPFGLKPLINKKVGTEAASQSSVTPMFPPGFSPLPDDDVAGHSDAHNCLWISNNVRIMWFDVYAPQVLQDKIALWSSISNPTRNWDGILIALGDFNMTDKWGSKMSKLDRFLVSESFYDAFPHTTGVILEKGIPDHQPVLLKEHSVDYGPILFRFFHSWLELDGFHKLIEDTWKCDGIVETNGLEHVLRLATIDAKIDNGITNDLDFKNRRESIKVLGEVDRLEASDLAQKAWKILTNRLGLVISSCISPEQSAFIKGRNILDGPFILNEVMNWSRKRKEKLMIFKVDFEKAFDSLRWDFLDTIMEKLWFGLRWRVWIKGCFVNARSSILVNGSPTTEFFVSKGLRQRDPLSPFLFILAMEGLHALVCKAINVGIFKGASVGNEHLRVSHLIYADNVIFVGQCLLGACVSEEEVSDMASIIGCGAATFPLTYLGVPVGSRLLSVGGRLTLLKSVLGNLPTYFMSLYHMPVSIRSKLESLRSNFFLGSDLGIYGRTCGISDSRVHGSSQSPWRGILSMVKSIKLKGVDLLSLCRRKLGCNVANRLSLPDWGSVLRRNSRGGIEAYQFKDLRLLIELVVLNSHQDTWTWSLGVLKGYTVASVRSLIDLHFLGANLNITRWNRSIPIKVNVFMWRAMLNKLPTSANLDRKGIEVDSLLCPICHEDVETVNHIFFTCDLAKVIWDLLAKWWELDVSFCASISDWLSWLDSSSISSKARVFLDGVGAALMCTGDLYLVTSPSPIPHAYLVSQHTWHQRLGHPGSDVLRRLVSSNFIACNKEKPLVICHACQLGKHVRLPFVSLDTVINHYSHFVLVYPLFNKSYVLSKFVLFRQYVHTQFKCEIKSFQCDHGGKFDNQALHKIFADNGIQFRFSCAKTSQQNGKSERMVEALNMATHLLNILPSTAIVNNIPYTRLFGKDADYSLLRTFGRYKARLVANGSTQLEGVDVDETFSLVVKPGTIRTVLSLTASRHWPIHQLDVKSIFYMRSLYGLKQPPSPELSFSGLPLILRGLAFLIVDVTPQYSEFLLQQLIGSLHQEFAMTDLGSLNYFLGIPVTRDSSGLFLSQKKYAIEILERAHMVKENQEKDKIRSKPDKNGKRDEAEKSLKQLQWIKEEKPKKTQKEWSKTHTRD
nr:RNA-directed DNA polymerase, eukaryota, reverse transcriptase zinc-binding domain protein [Tanacetum cinerariifolium]